MRARFVTSRSEPVQGHRRWIVLGWAIGGAVLVQQRAALTLSAGNPVDWAELLGTAARSSILWMLISIGAVEWTRVLPTDRLSRTAIGWCHLVGAGVANAIDVTYDMAVFRLLGRGGWERGFPLGFSYQFLNNALFYAVVVAAYSVAVYVRRDRERHVNEARLEAQLARARLDALRMQVQPHFLFNTLHAVTAVLYDRPGDAERMLLRLGDLLRATAEDLGRQFVTLEEELGLLGAYLDIELIRFEGRLSVEMDVPTDVLDVEVPTLLLQPLVENAIKHGIAKQVGAGIVRVTVRRRKDGLMVTIANNAPPSVTIGHDGIGLTNTRQRLATLFGGRATLAVGRTSADRVEATITLPHRPTDSR